MHVGVGFNIRRENQGLHIQDNTKDIKFKDKYKWLDIFFWVGTNRDNLRFLFQDIW